MMHIRTVALSLLAASVGGIAAPAGAIPPSGELNYMVDHSLLGCVSLAKNSISHEGDTIVIESEGKLEAKFGPIIVRSEDFVRREVYEDGRLVEYTSTTVENRGKDNEIRHQVSTEFADGNLTVMTDDGTYQAPAPIYTTNILFVEAAEANHLIGSKTGVLHTVDITRGETETVELEQGLVQATHYKVDGTALVTDLWYDEQDVLVKFIVDDGGNPVDVTLTERESCDE